MVSKLQTRGCFYPFHYIFRISEGSLLQTFLLAIFNHNSWCSISFPISQCSVFLWTLQSELSAGKLNTIVEGLRRTWRILFGWLNFVVFHSEYTWVGWGIEAFGQNIVAEWDESADANLTPRCIWWRLWVKNKFSRPFCASWNSCLFYLSQGLGKTLEQFFLAFVLQKIRRQVTFWSI